ncbi:MAG: hypothetical protein IJD58_11115 [Lachnospiraceae bacterium]|nr:hypothetical protein [Lachnospiraceae bacterium]
MAEERLSDEVLNALVENTKVIEANNRVLEAQGEKTEKKDKKEANVIAEPKVNSSLTGDEKARYANIGKEMFAPVLSSLEKLIKREKKKNEMLIKDDAATVEDNLKIQYETKPDPQAEGGGSSWLTVLLGILAVAGVAIALFHDKIGEFFGKIWDWVTEMFSSIANFFSTENGSSPISKILKICGDALGALWSFVKPIFKKMGEFGKTIWDGIKAGWDKFITGPDGILNFGVKVVKGIISFASNAISWIGNAIKSAVMGPINMIFGGAEDDGKAAGEEAAQDVKASVNQEATDAAARQKAITDDVLFNAEKADAAIIETAQANRDAALQRAKEQGLEVKDGRVTDESLKEHAAKAGLDAFMKANGIDKVDSEEYEKYKNEFMKFVELKDGEAKINMEGLKNHLNKIADDESSIWTIESDFIDGLQNMTTDQINSINGSVTGALQEGLQVTADMKAAENLENMTEEERFEARLRQAMNSGESAEFRFMEGRKMILESAELIKSTFGNYDENIRKNFTSTWASFMKDFLDKIQIIINTSTPQDNSTNNYQITPLHKETFTTMANQLVSLAQASLDVVTKQNNILGEICLLLANPPAPPAAATPIIADNAMDKLDEGANYVAKSAKSLIANLADAVTFWD